MPRYGYARVSTTDQDLTLQREALRAAGCAVVCKQRVSGTSRPGRGQLDILPTFLQHGDELVVTRADRLARSIGALQDIVRELRTEEVALIAAEQPIDTSAVAGKAFVDMQGVFAGFEANLRCERQMKDIAKAKGRGVYEGCKPSVNADEVRRLRTEALRPAEIVTESKISRSTVWRALEDAVSS